MVSCEHDWNDTVVIAGHPHAVAICDLCGRVAFEKGHEPAKPVYFKQWVEAPEE